MNLFEASTIHDKRCITSMFGFVHNSDCPLEGLIAFASLFLRLSLSPKTGESLQIKS